MTRRTADWRRVGAVLVLGGTIGAWAAASRPGSAAEDRGPKKDVFGPIPTDLADLLETALRSNPEILVAEAKVRQAQAELNQARLGVTKQVLGLHNQRRALGASLAAAKESLEIVEKMVASGQVSMAERSKAILGLAEAEAALTAWDAQVRYVLGQGGEASLSTPPAAESAPLGGEASPPRVPRPDVPEKFQAALETPVAFSFEETPIAEVIGALKGRASPTVAFVVDREVDAQQMTVTLAIQTPIPLGEALLMLHDAAPDLVFVFRDYGVYVTTRDRATGLPGATIPPEVPRYDE